MRELRYLVLFVLIAMLVALVSMLIVAIGFGLDINIGWVSELQMRGWKV